MRLIRTLQGRYGLSTQSDVLRFALRTVGEVAGAQAAPGPHLGSKPAHRAEAGVRRQKLLAEARALSGQAQELHRRVALYLKEHKGEVGRAAWARAPKPGL